MDVWLYLQAYLIISTDLAGTSYFTLFRPAVELAEEIIEERLTMHRGWRGLVLWLIITSILSPVAAYALLKNNNSEFIENYAVIISEGYIEDED